MGIIVEPRRCELVRAAEYQRVLKDFGIEAELRRTPWMGETRLRGMYLNSNKDVGGYITLLPASRMHPDPRLWVTLDPTRLQKKDRGFANIVPREGVLRAGIRQLLRSGGYTGIRMHGGAGGDATVSESTTPAKKFDRSKYDRENYAPAIWVLLGLAGMVVVGGILYLWLSKVGESREAEWIRSQSTSPAPRNIPAPTPVSIRSYQYSIGLWVDTVDRMLEAIRRGQHTRADCEKFFDIQAGGAESRYHDVFVQYDSLSQGERTAAQESFNAARAKYKDVFAVVNRECRRIGH